MRRRLRKQIAVLTVLAGFFGGIIALIVAIVYEPPPPPPLPPPVYADLVSRSATFLRTGEGRADLLALVRNPNANAGVRQVTYTFEVRAGARTLATVPGSTFFLPGQEKPVVAIGVAVPLDATDVAVRFGSPEWVAVAPGFQGPSLIVVNRVGEIRNGAAAVYVVKGVLANESYVDYLTVEVTVLGLSPEGDVVGVGRTFIGSLLSRERREFTVSWPLPQGRVVARTQEFPEVNVFSPSAVQPRVGVPGAEPRPTPVPGTGGVPEPRP